MKLFKSFNKFKENIALIDNKNTKISYKEILNQSNKIKKKIKKRSLILIISENSIGSLLSYIFCILDNHVAIIIDSKTKKKNIIKIFKKYNPNYIFVSKSNFSFMKRFCNKQYSFCEYILLKNKFSKKIVLNKDLSILLSTSGSMGSSKFVKLSKINIKFNADSIIKYLKIIKNDAAITNLPISYSYMLSIINTHLEVGGRIVVTDRSIIEKEFWKIFNNNRITSFNGVPYTFEILKKIGMNKVNSGSLRYITQAGGKLDDDIMKKLSFFCRINKISFFSMYGQTEASPRISYLDPKFLENKIGSIGKEIPGTKIYLVDDNNVKISKPFTKGEIVAKGKNIFMGYSNNYKDLKKPNSEKLTLKTGDLGYFDNDGFFYISSRVNKIAKIYGNRIDIGVLETLMGKKGFNVVCTSNNKIIFTFYENKYNRNILSKAISSITNLNERSFEFIKLKSFPRTSNNKISYNKLNKLHD